MIRKPGYRPGGDHRVLREKGKWCFFALSSEISLLSPGRAGGNFYVGDKMGRLIFVTGGTRSGKSAFAEEVAAALGSDVTYIATARAGDSEMAERIALHRERRPESWRTVEEPEEVRKAIEYWGKRSEVILLDCLTIYISNLLLAGENGGADNNGTAGGGSISDSAEFNRNIVSAVKQIATAAKTAKAHVVVVSNEVGLSLVSPYPLGRQYQEIVGRANQVLARDADETFLVVAGIPLDLKEMGRQVRERFREEKVRRD